MKKKKVFKMLRKALKALLIGQDGEFRTGSGEEILVTYYNKVEAEKYCNLLEEVRAFVEKENNGIPFNPNWVK